MTSSLPVDGQKPDFDLQIGDGVLFKRRNKSLLGKNIGIFNVDDPLSGFEIRNKEAAKIAFPILKNSFYGK